MKEGCQIEKISTFILKSKVFVILSFLILTVICIFLNSKVKINYNLSDYLPKDAKSLVALKEMTSSYQEVIPNVRLVIKNVTIEESLSYKNKIEKVKGVKNITWADDYINISSPYFNVSQIKDWYKNNDAMYLISIDNEKSLDTIENIKKVVKKDSLLAGDAVNIAMAQDNIYDEVNKILIFVIPIILIILLLTTSSWLEPFLFIIAIGIAIIINMGTNLIFGEISSITRTTVAILQLAVSMDYAIFLLHRFASLRHSGRTVEESMSEAMTKSASVIIASALTTILGFLALVIMQFKIGPDLGLVLAKGVIFSLISVLFLLPVLAVYTYKLIDKTHHRSLIPSFHTIGKGIIKLRFGIIIIILLILIPSFIASHNNTYLYGSTGVNSETSKVYKDTVSINKEFGVNNQMVLLVPDHDLEKEASLVSDLESIVQIKEVTSFISIFGTKLPIQYLPPDITSKFISEKYSRIIITTNLPEEGEKTFSLIEKVKHLSSKYYNDRYHLAGISVTNYDMKEIVTKDNLIVNIVAIISIVLILILTFKAFIIPIILIMSIEMAIWINLSIVYLMGHSLNYIGYLIISTVQLGATVDYAILFAKKYLEKRKSMTKKDAVMATIEDTTPSILSSALILGISGLSLGFISSNGVISELGSLVGRGALISALMVLLFTSSLFMLLDKYIFKKKKEETIDDEEKQMIE